MTAVIGPEFYDKLLAERKKFLANGAQHRVIDSDGPDCARIIHCTCGWWFRADDKEYLYQSMEDHFRKMESRCICGESAMGTLNFPFQEDSNYREVAVSWCGDPECWDPVIQWPAIRRRLLQRGDKDLIMQNANA